MIRLMKSVTHANIAQALSLYFNLPVVRSFKFLAQGGENTSILVDMDGQQLVLRFWGAAHSSVGSRRESDIRGELDMMSYFYENHLPIPKIYNSLAGNLYEQTVDGTPYMVMACAPGVSPRDFTPDMASQVAKVMGVMHVLSPHLIYPQERTWPGTIISLAYDRSKQHLIRFGGRTDDASRMIQSVMRSFLAVVDSADLTSLPMGAIHGDIMFENIMFEDGKLTGIFDFDDYRYSYFLEDIAKSLLFAFESEHDCMFGSDGGNVGPFLSAYESERKLSEQERSLLPVFFTARFLYKLTKYLEQLNSGETNCQPLVDANIRRYQTNEKFFALQ